MSSLATLKLVAAKKPPQQNPITQRRAKLSNKLQEQILLAKAEKDGSTYAPTRTKTVKNADGERVQVTLPKRIKPWWFKAEAGKVCIEIRYGARVLELSKGKGAIEVSSPAGLIDALEAVNAAVLAGELDEQIEVVSQKRREFTAPSATAQTAATAATAQNGNQRTASSLSPGSPNSSAGASNAKATK
jgi:hypothetical protein